MATKIFETITMMKVAVDQNNRKRHIIIWVTVLLLSLTIILLRHHIDVNIINSNGGTTSTSQRRRIRDAAATTAAALSHHQQQEERQLDIHKYYQPKVTHVETGISTRVFGSISMPKGSKWCGNRPTYWLIGHEKFDRPWCYDEQSGTWKDDGNAELDLKDERNAEDGVGSIDRHDCISMDVNQDHIYDIVCTVGANRGTKEGYNELYLTQPDGSLRKIPKNGLQKYPTMRTRLTVTLKSAVKEYGRLLFILTNGVPREDKKRNNHRMFRNIPTFPYFVEVPDGPWVSQHYDPACAIVADLNQDGFDDMIVCKKEGRVQMYIQKADGTFHMETKMPSTTVMNDWGNVRVADMNNDGRSDLVVVGGKKESSYVRIFRGKVNQPYFDFDEPIYELELAHSTPDVEVLDVDEDGLLDLYLIQTNRLSKYCGATSARSYLNQKSRPPPEWTPPFDNANDVLLLGMGFDKHPHVPFKQIEMQHQFPGCGYLLERFGSMKKLILAQGSPTRQGYNLLLEWKKG